MRRFFQPFGTLSQGAARKTLLSIGVYLTVFAAPTAQANNHNYDVFFNAGDTQSLTGVRGLTDIKALSNGMLFATTTLVQSNSGDLGGSVGLAHRTLFDDHILGFHGSLDLQRRRNASMHHQMAAGAEWLTDTWDGRVNAYVPTSKALKVGQFRSSTTTKDEFQGNALQRRVTGFSPSGYVTEEAFTTLDAEIGHLIPNDRALELRGYVGAYASSADTVGSTLGGRIRLEAVPTDNFKAEFALLYDEFLGGRASLNLALSLGKKPTTSGVRPLQDRFRQPISRMVGVSNSSTIDSKKRTVYNNDTSTVGSVTPVSDSPQTIAHIDNSHTPNTTATKGTAENPFVSIDECKSTQTNIHCGNAKAIYIHSGKSVKADTNGKRDNDQNNATPYSGHIQLNDEQILAGDGATSGVFKFVSNKLSPVLVGKTASTPIVTMGNETTLQGIRFGWHYGFNASNANAPFKNLSNGVMTNTAILSDNKDGVNISDIVITGYTESINGGTYSNSNNFTTGIHIKSTEGEKNTSIKNTIIQSSLVDAVLVEAAGNGNTDIKQFVSIKGSDLTRNGRGVHVSVSANAPNGQDIKQTVKIGGNIVDRQLVKSNITKNNNEGILVESLSKADQIIRVNQTQITDNIGAGIFANFGESSSTNGQTGSELDISETFIVQNEGGGVGIISNGGNSNATLKDTLMIGNIPKPRGASIQLNGTYDTALDGTAQNKGYTQARGIGLYAENKDTNSVSNQKVGITGDYRYIGHTRSQVYMRSNVNQATSKQTFNIATTSTPNINKLYTDKGKIVIKQKSNGQDYYALEAETDPNNPSVNLTIERTLGHWDGTTNCVTRNQEFTGDALKYIVTDPNVGTCTEKEIQ